MQESCYFESSGGGGGEEAVGLADASGRRAPAKKGIGADGGGEEGSGAALDDLLTGAAGVLLWLGMLQASGQLARVRGKVLKKYSKQGQIDVRGRDA